MRNIFLALLIAILGGCRSTAPLDDASFQVVDLTHPLDERTIFWPTSPSKFQLERLSHGMTEAGFFYAANSFCMPEHGGTHLDAPIHFAEGGWTTDQIPIDRLVGPGAVIDVSAKAESNPDYRLTREDVLQWERIHGRIPSGAIVLLRTGWSRRWPDRRSYMGDDTPGDASRLHFPSYGEDSARLLVEDRRVHALGVDTASIDYGPSSDFVVHRLANGANVPGLENLTGLEMLPPIGATVIALPIMIGGGSGGPARVIAVLPR
jgi:kynurenine formamidase